MKKEIRGLHVTIFSFFLSFFFSLTGGFFFCGWEGEGGAGGSGGRGVWEAKGCV